MESMSQQLVGDDEIRKCQKHENVRRESDDSHGARIHDFQEFGILRLECHVVSLGNGGVYDLDDFVR